MDKFRISTLVACVGGVAYTVGKIDLAIRGELGMPGFPAPESSYGIYDPVSGQLSNAAMGVVMIVVAAWLLKLPRNKPLRMAVLTVNWLGAAMIAAGFVGFTLRATGVAPALGAPATGYAAWVALGVAAVWAVAWATATWEAQRRTQRPSPVKFAAPANP